MITDAITRQGWIDDEDTESGQGLAVFFAFQMEV